MTKDTATKDTVAEDATTKNTVNSKQAKSSEIENGVHKDGIHKENPAFDSPSFEISEGEVVWYNERKGYGFVRIEDTEIFLHRSTLDRFGLVRLLKGDLISVSLTENEHGKVIQDLLALERPVTPTPPMASAPEANEVRAVVKFFNDMRGYGFVTAENIKDDVFVHSRVLSDCGFQSLLQGQKLLVKVDDSGRGPQVQAVRLLDE